MLEKKTIQPITNCVTLDLVISDYNVFAYIQTLRQSNRSRNVNMNRKNIDSLGQLYENKIK
jgi:hypothetical protein